MTQETRLEALQACIDKYNLDLTEDYSGAEDIKPYLEGKEKIEKYAAITRAGENDVLVYIYPCYSSIAAAKTKATFYVNDSLFAEYPVAIVNLDTGLTYQPNWNSVHWSKI